MYYIKFKNYNQGGEGVNIDLDDIERKIVSYYRDLKQLAWLKSKQSLLEKQLQEIKKDMDNGNINFATDIKAVSYDAVSVQNSISQGLEKNIDSGYRKLENEYLRIQEKITDTKLDIRFIEENTAHLGYIISLLNENSRRLLELYYLKCNKSYVAIGLEMNVSHSTVSRLKRETLRSIHMLYNYRFNK